MYSYMSFLSDFCLHLSCCSCVDLKLAYKLVVHFSDFVRIRKPQLFRPRIDQWSQSMYSVIIEIDSREVYWRISRLNPYFGQEPTLMNTKRFSSFVKNRAMSPFRDPNLKLGVQKADCHIAMDIVTWKLWKSVQEIGWTAFASRVCFEPHSL